MKGGILMSNTNLFCEMELPSPLNDDELMEQLIKSKFGDVEARNKLINHNLRLVLFIAKRYIGVCDGLRVEFDDLVMAGMLGLVKGVDTYIINKQVKLCTYISKCINNEIFLYLRKCRKVITGISLDEPFCDDLGCSNLSLGDTISDNKDYFEVFIKECENIKIREVMMELDDMDRRIIAMNFGFIDDRVYTQKEIGEEFGLSQSYVSRKVRNISKTLKKRLKQEKVIY